MQAKSLRVTLPLTSARRVVHSFVALASAEAISRLIAFGVALYLARILGPEAYGVVALAIGVNLYLGKVADFGIEAAGIKEVVEAGTNLKRLAAAVMGARMALATGLTALAIFIGASLMPSPENIVLPLYFLTLLPIAASTKWIHMGLGQIRLVGVARIVGELLILSLMVTFVRGPEDLLYVPLVQLAGESAVALLLYGFLITRGNGFRPTWNLRTALPVFSLGFPLFVQLTLGLLLYNADLVFLRALRSKEEVGYYAAAYALISFVANLGMTYAMSLLPAISRLRNSGPEEQELFRSSLLQTYGLALPITVGAVFLAPQIIFFGFGEGYSGSVPALQILACSIPFFTLRNVPWVALIARGRGHLLTRTMFWSVLINLVLNAALVPRWGVVGAAIATVAAEFYCCSGMLAASKKEGLPFVSLRSLWRPTLAAAVMGISLLFIGSFGPMLGAAFGAVFAGAMIVFALRF